MSELQAAASDAAPPTETAGSGSFSLVAVVGAPNCGKSTLFNRLTGLRQKVANYPGVTVEKRLGKVRVDAGREITLVDLPGIYSLTARSEDERVARGVLLGEMPGLPRPDAILLVVDSTNLNRNLSLAAPILALKIPTLIVLNMSDDLRTRGGLLDGERLSERLGVPVVQASAAKGEGLKAVVAFLSGRPATPGRLELPVLQDIGSCRRWAARAAGPIRLPGPGRRRLDPAPGFGFSASPGGTADFSAGGGGRLSKYLYACPAPHGRHRGHHYRLGPVDGIRAARFLVP